MIPPSKEVIRQSRLNAFERRAPAYFKAAAWAVLVVWLIVLFVHLFIPAAQALVISGQQMQTYHLNFED